MKVLDIYSQYPITLVKGQGHTVTDSSGTEYMDFYGGHGVISIGHSHPDYKAALTKQLGELVFYSNAFINPLQYELAEKLGKISGYDKANLFMANSGAEANENAVKAASFINGRKKVLAISGAFHGRTAGAVAMTNNPKIQPPFGSNIEVDFIAFSDKQALKKHLETKEYTAFIVEGIQGVNGIWEGDTDFWKLARELCTTTETLLIADEIQSGYGRSGLFFAHQYHGIVADIVTMAKGMGNGFPVGGLIISDNLKLEKGMLGTTFGGAQLACTAAISVIDVMQHENLIKNTATIGNYLIEKIKQIDEVTEVRGRGLMLGIEFSISGKAVRTALINNYKIITGFSAPEVLRLLPPLNITKTEADAFIDALKKAVNEVKANS